MDIADRQIESTNSRLTVARTLHPEDIAIGDDVALSHVVYQYPSFCWIGADTAVVTSERPVRMTFLPCGDHDAAKVVSLCLPFVLCESSSGRHQVYDTRQVQLVRLDADFANSVRNAFRENVATKKKKKKRKGKRK